MQRRSLWLWGPVVVDMAVIFALSSLSDPGPLLGNMSDKTGHSLGYALLGVLLLRALAQGSLKGVSWRTSVLTILFATLYGVSDEFHQYFVPGRSADVLDLLADARGAALAVASIAAIKLVVATSRWRLR